MIALRTAIEVNVALRFQMFRQFLSAPSMGPKTPFRALLSVGRIGKNFGKLKRAASRRLFLQDVVRSACHWSAYGSYPLRPAAVRDSTMKDRALHLGLPLRLRDVMPQGRKAPGSGLDAGEWSAFHRNAAAGLTARYARINSRCC
jgi:hypothetical protein